MQRARQLLAEGLPPVALVWIVERSAALDSCHPTTRLVSGVGAWEAGTVSGSAITPDAWPCGVKSTIVGLRPRRVRRLIGNSRILHDGRLTQVGLQLHLARVSSLPLQICWRWLRLLLPELACSLEVDQEESP